MSVRRRALPRGWYPDEPEALRALVSSWVPGFPAAPPAIAVVAPHAGWAFSGRLAARAIGSLRPPREGASDPPPGSPPRTIVVFGGHLAPGAAPLAALEQGYETPLGPVDSDPELLEALDARVPLGRDLDADNTVEVLLPLVAALFSGSRALWLRAPNDLSSLALGEALAAAAASIGRPLSCVGSTDLTHYGPNYGFIPKGGGDAAAAWVRDVNDRRFLDALLALDGEAAVERGEAERSACSSGAAAAALAFAKASGASRAELLEYATSLDQRADDSFVGYAALAFYR
jgi:MEMO1 family protein